jgi:hypothetical protein
MSKMPFVVMRNHYVAFHLGITGLFAVSKTTALLSAKKIGGFFFPELYHLTSWSLKVVKMFQGTLYRRRTC